MEKAKKIKKPSIQRDLLRVATDLLFKKGYIIDCTGSGIGYRVYDAKANVKVRLLNKSFAKISELLQEVEHKKYVIDLTKVRKLRRNTWIKRLYLYNRRLPKNLNS